MPSTKLEIWFNPYGGNVKIWAIHDFDKNIDKIETNCFIDTYAHVDAVIVRPEHCARRDAMEWLELYKKRYPKASFSPTSFVTKERWIARAIMGFNTGHYPRHLY